MFPKTSRISLLLFLWVSLLPVVATAQFCGGNLGENIFTEGDFGSGAANIPPNDPMLAPGFIYQRNPPPNDGFYTITNNTGAWPNLYDTWLPLRDNSPDPLGYMMVVNANFQPGIIYSQTVDGLCENTNYQFTADMINLIKRGSNNLLPNVSFLINDIEFYTTGPIPENETWTTYGFSFSTLPGQSTVTLSLRNNAPGGIGNDIAFDNIAFRPCGPEAQITPGSSTLLCEDGTPLALLRTVIGDQYPTPVVRWQRSPDGQNGWTDIPGATDSIYVHTELSAGTYYYRYLLANNSSNLTNSKCRVTSNTETVIVLPKEISISETLCEGDTLFVGSSAYTRSGVYRDSLLSSIGCDSIVTATLTILPDPGIVVPVATTDPSCDYLDDGSLRLGRPIGGTPPVILTLDGRPVSAGDSLTGLPAGRYTYTALDRVGCRTTATVTLTAPPEFSIALVGDERVLLGDPARVTVQGSEPIVSLTWQSVPAGNCDSCLTNTFLPAESQRISVQAVTAAGCVAVDSFSIQVIDDRQVYLPNAFSPNNDGVNDRFFVQGGARNVVAIRYLRVFNRWGAEVFATTDEQPVNTPLSGWDGTVNGEPAPTGTYLYMTQVLFRNGETAEYAGELQLLR